MRAGKLIHRVTIQRLTAELDDAGQPTVYEDFATNVAARVDNVAARVDGLSGGEKRNQERTVDQGTHKVCIRYKEGILGEMRVIWRGTTLEILQVSNPDSKRIEHELICLEVANA